MKLQQQPLIKKHGYVTYRQYRIEILENEKFYELWIMHMHSSQKFKHLADEIPLCISLEGVISNIEFYFPDYIAGYNHLLFINSCQDT